MTQNFTKSREILTASAHLLGGWGKLCKALWGLRKRRKALYSNQSVYHLQWVRAFIWLMENSLGRLRERTVEKTKCYTSKRWRLGNMSDQLVQDFYFSICSCIYSTTCKFYPWMEACQCLAFPLLFARLTVSVRFPVPELQEISLSMLCSSSEALLCDNNTTRTAVFNQVNLSPLGHKQHFD